MPEIFIFKFFSSPYATIFYAQYIVIIIFSITLHELSHGWAALDQGDDTPTSSGHMTLNPVIHMGLPSLVFLFLYGICWGAMPINPSKFRSEKWGEILVAAAGPLMNLSLVFISILIFNLCCNFLEPTSRLQAVLGFFEIAAVVNLGLFILNMIPLPPFDGFHVLSGLMPSFKSLKGSPVGLAVLVLFFVVGFSIFHVASVLLTELFLNKECLVWFANT